MVAVTIDEAMQRLAELIHAVQQGETIIITKGDLPVATLSAVTNIARRPQFGSAKGSILWMAEDFDAPLEDFSEYLG